MQQVHILIGFGAYLLALSAAAVIMTITDKLHAQKNKRRIAESSFFIVALFGGAFAEYAAMRLIRHKTRRKKFMVGLPLIMILHAIVAALIVYFFYFRSRA